LLHKTSNKVINIDRTYVCEPLDIPVEKAMTRMRLFTSANSED